jgi:hypothetical protein
VQAAANWAQQFPLAALLATVGLLLALVRRQSGRLPMLLWAVLAIVAHTLLGVRSYFWYYVPFAPVLGLLAGDAAAASAGWLVDRFDQHRHAALRTASIILALALALVPAVMAAATLATPQPPRIREQAYFQTAETLRDLCASRNQPPLVGMGEIGLIGYVSNCPIVDFSGLLQRDVAHLRLHPTQKLAWTIQRYQPELVVLAGLPRDPLAPSQDSWFRKRYEALKQDRVEGFLSVIYARDLGPENQRDLQNASWWRSPKLAHADGPTLYFAPGASPAITAHVFLPSDSSLAIAVNGQPVASLTGARPGWQDVHLPVAGLGDVVELDLAGSAGDQPALAAWIESNALPALHYFVPLEDASTHPRPTLALEPGASRSVQLARPKEEPVALDVFYRDKPGARIAVTVNEELRDVIGGTDGWRTDQVPLPSAATYTVELRNVGDIPVRIARVALTKPFGAALSEE